VPHSHTDEAFTDPSSSKSGRNDQPTQRHELLRVVACAFRPEGANRMALYRMEGHVTDNQTAYLDSNPGIEFPSRSYPILGVCGPRQGVGVKTMDLEQEG
jgi:hypothetical protein